MDLTGVVLCGGRSSRMGRDKALLPVGGAPMARRVADALAAAGAAEVLALGGDLGALAAFGLRAAPDASPGEGPFPATIHALALAAHPMVLVVSCDLLQPSPDALRTVAERLAAEPSADAAVPVVDGHHQWTHAAWRTSAAPVLQAARDAGVGSLRRGSRGLRLLELHDLPPEALRDADAPEDLPGPGTLPLMDVPAIDVQQLAELRAQGAPLIDVREPHEHEEARVPGAVLIPLGEVADRTAEVPSEGTVYVICAAGGRSAKAVEHYRSLGIDAVNVAGGTRAWIEAGHATDSGPGGA